MKLIQAIDVRSSSAESEVAQAARWATLLGATVDLAFVDDYEYSAHRIRDRRIRDHVVAEWGNVQLAHHGELQRLLNTLPEAARGEARYLHGRAAQTLLAVEQDYDVLVVSTRGRRGIAQAFLGSVAERLVRESTLPVLVLRRGEVDDGEADS